MWDRDLALKTLGMLVLAGLSGRVRSTQERVGHAVSYSSGL
ncbi:hypothetical protein [Pseudoalteromonas rubra]|nr:hypothetical protein [Pseudoalteromonas rubra]